MTLFVVPRSIPTKCEFGIVAFMLLVLFGLRGSRFADKNFDLCRLDYALVALQSEMKNVNQPAMVLRVIGCPLCQRLVLVRVELVSGRGVDNREPGGFQKAFYRIS